MVKATIGDRVRKLRKRAALTQDELSAQTGISQTTIPDIELDKAVMDLDELSKICDVLACTPKDIIGDNYDKDIFASYEEASRFSDDHYEYVTVKRKKRT
jgi:transcriptional regulator with XRE-family HTH domain